MLDLRNMRFGFLTAVRPTDKRGTDGSVIWECRCRCGNSAFVSSNKLRMHKTSSCGCAAQKALRESKTFVGGTCVEIATSTKIPKSNTSGFRGVSRKRGKWQAYITFCGQTKTLGTYENIEDAVDARRRAEAERAREIEAMLTLEDKRLCTAKGKRRCVWTRNQMLRPAAKEFRLRTPMGYARKQMTC